jgi:hypothetical protein
MDGGLFDLADLAERIAQDAAELAETVRDGAVVSTELAVVRLARDLDRLTGSALQEGVRRARAAGRTWQEIGELLGVSRQAAFQRFGRPVDPRTGEAMSASVLPGAGELAAGVLADFFDGRYAELCARFTEEAVAKGGTPERLASARAQLAGLVGAYERMGEPIVSPLGDHTMVNVPLTFEAGEMKGRVSFEADGKVAGLFVLHPDAP